MDKLYCYDCHRPMRSGIEHRATQRHKDSIRARGDSLGGVETRGEGFARMIRQALSEPVENDNQDIEVSEWDGHILFARRHVDDDKDDVR